MGRVRPMRSRRASVLHRAGLCAILLGACAVAREFPVAAALAGDAAGTVDLQRRGGVESALVLGPHPSTPRIVLYFAACLALHGAIAAALPEPYREAWQWGVALPEAWQVGFNHAQGLWP